ncbi:MAG: tetratricopeptide repeat protein [Bacteroidota bacterium]
MNYCPPQDLVVDNECLEMYIRSTLGEVYNDMKDYARSDQQYDKVLELDPNDASALNNYAYYLSLRKEKLQKAEEMSKSSIELQPDEASYEDTYGWILFVGGKYAEAKLWIGRSLEHGGDKSAAVLEHYGDVLFKLGDMAGALDYWQRAKSAGEGASEFLDRKILEKKYLE